MEFAQFDIVAFCNLHMFTSLVGERLGFKSTSLTTLRLRLKASHVSSLNKLALSVEILFYRLYRILKLFVTQHFSLIVYSK